VLVIRQFSLRKQNDVHIHLVHLPQVPLQVPCAPSHNVIRADSYRRYTIIFTLVNYGVIGGCRVSSSPQIHRARPLVIGVPRFRHRVNHYDSAYVLSTASDCFDHSRPVLQIGL
jgi:hypothetical protein